MISFAAWFAAWVFDRCRWTCASLRVSPRRSACGGEAGQVRENPKTGPYVDGLSTLPVTSYDAMMTILKLLLVGSGYQQAMMIILKFL